jgi:hypothetical protein
MTSSDDRTQNDCSEGQFSNAAFSILATFESDGKIRISSSFQFQFEKQARPMNRTVVKDAERRKIG